jgi:hypothetical protein
MSLDGAGNDENQPKMTLAKAFVPPTMRAGGTL